MRGEGSPRWGGRAGHCIDDLLYRAILASESWAHAVPVADVGDIDRDAFLDSADVEEVAAILGDQGVDQHDLSGAPGSGDAGPGCSQ